MRNVTQHMSEMIDFEPDLWENMMNQRFLYIYMGSSYCFIAGGLLWIGKGTILFVSAFIFLFIVFFIGWKTRIVSITQIVWSRSQHTFVFVAPRKKNCIVSFWTISNNLFRLASIQVIHVSTIQYRTQWKYPPAIWRLTYLTRYEKNLVNAHKPACTNWRDILHFLAPSIRFGIDLL